MREINVSEVVKTISRLCVEANYNLGEDMFRALD